MLVLLVPSVPIERRSGGDSSKEEVSWEESQYGIYFILINDVPWLSQCVASAS